MKTRLLLFSLLLSAIAFGQSTRRSSLGLELGPSMPLSHYASQDATLFSDSSTSYPGFAKTGLMMRMVYEHRLTHNFGIQADFMFGYNNVDQLAMADSLGSKINADLSLTATRPWNIGGILVGPFFRIPFGESFSFMARGKLGGVGVYSPEYTVTGTSNTDQSKLEYYQYVNKSVAFIWDVGAGFQYRLEQYSFNLYGDYLSSRVDFVDVPGQDWSAIPPEETSINFRQEIKAITITFGVSYIF